MFVFVNTEITLEILTWEPPNTNDLSAVKCIFWFKKHNIVSSSMWHADSFAPEHNRVRDIVFRGELIMVLRSFDTVSTNAVAGKGHRIEIKKSYE